MPRKSKERPPRLFFSHSSEDKALLQELVEAARIGLNLNKGDIRCSSLDGYDFASGDDIVTRVIADGTESNSLIAVISPNSLRSSWVLFELGARWGFQGHFVVIVAGGADFKDLPEPVKMKRARRCVREDLESLFMDIADQLDLKFDLPSARRHLDAAEKISRAQAQFYLEAKKHVQMSLHNADSTAHVEILEPLDETIVPSHFDYKIELLSPPERGRSLWLCHEISGRLWPRTQLRFQGQFAQGTLAEGGSPPGGAFTLSVIELDAEGQRQVEDWLSEGEKTGRFPAFAKIQGSARVAGVRLVLDKS